MADLEFTQVYTYAKIFYDADSTTHGYKKCVHLFRKCTIFIKMKKKTLV